MPICKKDLTREMLEKAMQCESVEKPCYGYNEILFSQRPWFSAAVLL